MSAQEVVTQANAVLCTLAFTGLVWRLVGQWPVTRPFARTIVLLLASLELFVALGSARRAALGGEFNEVFVALLVHAVATLVVVAIWPRLAHATGEARRRVRSTHDNP